MSIRARKINRLVFIVFLAASAYALARALLPDNDSIGLIPWDKAKHFIVFYVLAILASLALPQSRLHRIGLVILAFGGAIEILQAFVGRDALVAGPVRRRLRHQRRLRTDAGQPVVAGQGAVLGATPHPGEPGPKPSVRTRR